MEPTQPSPDAVKSVRPLVRRGAWLDKERLLIQAGISDDPQDLERKHLAALDQGAAVREIQARNKRESGLSMRGRPGWRYLGSLSHDAYVTMRTLYADRWQEERKRILSAFGVFGDLRV